MECFATFLGIILLIVAIIGLAAFAQSRADRWNRAYQQLARRFGGKCTPAGWFGKPSVLFHHNGSRVVVDSDSAAGKGSVAYARVQIDWPDPSFRCEVFPGRASNALGRSPELRQVRISLAKFQQEYTVFGSDANDVQTLLSEGVCWQLDKLRHALGGDVYFAVQNGRMVVKKRTPIRYYEPLDSFVRMVLDLYDQALLTRSVGIEFTQQEQTAVPITEAVCQVCGENIETDMVFCSRCKTPHHRECWQYYGSCTTYACLETQFLVPRTAVPIGPLKKPGLGKERGSQ